MKLFKLGLLALTVSLVAAVIVLDKKNGNECGCNLKKDDDENQDDNNIIVEESML